jgi:hypothetical protein
MVTCTLLNSGMHISTKPIPSSICLHQRDYQYIPSLMILRFYFSPYSQRIRGKSITIIRAFHEVNIRNKSDKCVTRTDTMKINRTFPILMTKPLKITFYHWPTNFDEPPHKVVWSRGFCRSEDLPQLCKFQHE